MKKIFVAFLAIALAMPSIAQIIPYKEIPLTGTVSVNPADFKGDTGPAGPIGPQGVPGIPGRDGMATFPTDWRVRYVSNQSEFKAALTLADAGLVNTIVMVKPINLGDSLQLPRPVANYGIEGNGLALTDTTPNGLSAMMYRNILTLADANKYTGNMPMIRNIDFQGKKRKGVAIRINAAYQPIIEYCRFSGFNTCIKLEFALQATVSNNKFQNSTIHVDADYARYGGPSSSQSNHLYMPNNRHRTTPGDFACVKATAISGLVIFHAIDEGGDTIAGGAPNDNHWGSDYFLYFDDGGSPNVMEATVDISHTEIKHPKATYRYNVKQGQYPITGGYPQYPGTLLWAEGKGGYPNFIIDRPTYAIPGAKQTIFLGGSAPNAIRLQFWNMPPQFDAFDATNYTGAKPTEVFQFGLVSNGQIFQIRRGGWNKDTGVLKVMTPVWQ